MTALQKPFQEALQSTVCICRGGIGYPSLSVIQLLQNQVLRFTAIQPWLSGLYCYGTRTQHVIFNNCITAVRTNMRKYLVPTLNWDMLIPKLKSQLFSITSHSFKKSLRFDLENLSEQEETCCHAQGHMVKKHGKGMDTLAIREIWSYDLSVTGWCDHLLGHPAHSINLTHPIYSTTL